MGIKSLQLILIVKCLYWTHLTLWRFLAVTSSRCLGQTAGTG